MKKINYALLCLMLFFAFGCSSNSPAPTPTPTPTPIPYLLGVWKVDLITTKNFDNTISAIYPKFNSTLSNLKYEFLNNGKLDISYYNVTTSKDVVSNCEYYMSSDNSFLFIKYPNKSLEKCQIIGLSVKGALYYKVIERDNLVSFDEYHFTKL